MTGWRLLLTRPAEETALLVKELAAHGTYACGMPLLEIEALPVTAEQKRCVEGLSRYCAVIAISKPAARLVLELIERFAGPPCPQQAWFSVGAATAAVLEAQGLSVGFPIAGDDSEALLALPDLQAALQGPAPRVLIVRGEGGRELLAERLRGLGAEVDYLELYRRRLPKYAGRALSERVRLERLNGLVVSSGQGFEHLRSLAGADWPGLAQLPLFVPSPRVAEMARAAGVVTVVDCRGASAAALLTALRETSAPSNQDGLL